jgi:hypothetical protein
MGFKTVAASLAPRGGLFSIYGGAGIHAAITARLSPERLLLSIDGGGAGIQAVAARLSPHGLPSASNRLHRRDGRLILLLLR